MKFSTSWASEWAKQNGVTSKVLHGEAGSMDKSAVADAIASLRDKLAIYNVEHIYNMDETWLNY
jgi:hypothetical protein